MILLSILNIGNNFMKILIEYESAWRNSFLLGTNNKPIPKQGRKFIGSMTNLKKSENYLTRAITKDTVMGVLNRLIGDQRKLYQSRNDKDYYFSDLESLITFNDEIKTINYDMTFIRNITGSTDQNSYTGLVKINDPIFSSSFSQEFWGVLYLNLNELCDFINNDITIVNNTELSPLLLLSKLDFIKKLKSIPIENSIEKAYKVLSNKYEKFNGIDNKGLLIPISLYCCALYLQLDRLSSRYDVTHIKTKAGGISGISNNGFTKKDFMSKYTTGDKKRIWGNPYIHEEYVKGEGKTKHLLTKASGTLTINIDLETSKANRLAKLIDSAGVSSFYLGKKGLAYLSKIKI